MIPSIVCVNHIKMIVMTSTLY